MDEDHLKYVFCVGRRYYGVHPDCSTPYTFVVGQVLRLECTHIDDYQIGGHLRRGRFRVEAVRKPSDQERKGLCLNDEAAPAALIVVLKQHEDLKSPTTLWPVIRLVYYWRWHAPRVRR